MHAAAAQTHKIPWVCPNIYCIVFQYLQGTSSSQFSTPQLTPSVSDTEYGSSEVSTLISIFMHFLM